MHEREMLIEAVRGVIARDAFVPAEGESPREVAFDRPLWSALVEHGFTLVNTPEAAGGVGAGLADAAAVVRVAGETAIAGPLAETLLVASWALAEAGVPIPAHEPLTAAADASQLRLDRTAAGWRAEGRLAGVPWGDVAACVVVADTAGGPQVALLPAAGSIVSPRRNMAGEPRPDLQVSVDLGADAVAPAPAGVDAAALLRRGALARAVAMVGGLIRCRELTVAYAAQRSQFGRTISKFQAVQQQVAELVAEVAAAEAAVDAAVAAESRHPAPNAVAVAKIRAGHAADVVTTLAHQLHGAIGITDEYELHHHTRRLWSWRDELGSASSWSARLGHAVAGHAASPTLSSLAQLAAR